MKAFAIAALVELTFDTRLAVVIHQEAIDAFAFSQVE